MNNEGIAGTLLAPLCKGSHTTIVWPTETLMDNCEKINPYNLYVLNLYKIFGPPYNKRIEIRTGGEVLYV